MNKQTLAMIERLKGLGISSDDALALRRISMTLHRWHELECGDSNEHGSWCIVRGHAPKREFYRDPETQRGMWRDVGSFVYDDNGAPYMERHFHRENGPRYNRIPDRERGALKRLVKIIKRYPALASYVQGDPRGAALYVIPWRDVPEGRTLDTCYSSGVAIHT